MKFNRKPAGWAILALLSATLAAASFSAGAATITSSSGFVNTAVANQTGTFTATFDATPSISPANDTLSFSNGAQTAYTGLAATVRFSTTGVIDARNGAAYAAAANVPFTAGKSYHFRMVINAANHTYSAYVTPAGGSELTIASNYGFRTEVAGITSINNFNADVNVAPGGSLTYTTPTIAGSSSSSSSVASSSSSSSSKVSSSSSSSVSSVSSSKSSSSSSLSGGTTINSSNGFVNSAVANQTGSFTATFDASASVSPSNATLGFSSGAQTAYTGVAATVRFNTTGTIDARNAGAYAAVTNVPFSANTTYHFRMVINLATKTYSAYVTAPGGAEQTLASNYGFRTEVAGITNINNFNTDVNATPGGSLTYTQPVVSTSSSSSSVSSSSSSKSSSPSSSSSSSSKSSSSSSSSTASGFKHPGVLVTRARLDYIKSQLGVEPFKSAYAAMAASTWASKTYAIQGPPSDNVIDCGASSTPNHGCSTEDSDASAAYTQALMWYFTGDATYAKNAIFIMNTYATNLTGGHTNANAPLQSAWTAEKWPAAAEIIRYTYTGWAATDISKFSSMLKTQYLPYINGTNGDGNNANWKLSMVDGMLGIAIFTDDRTLFNDAISTFKKWIPAAYYNNANDGGAPVTFSTSPTAGWNGQTVFNAATSGVEQETCRDTQHVGLAMAATFNAAETAYIQGTNIYSTFATRLTTSLSTTPSYCKAVETRTRAPILPCRPLSLACVPAERIPTNMSLY